MDIHMTSEMIPWYIAGLAVLVLVDGFVWGYALHLLPASRRSTVVKAVTWGWALIPMAAILVFASWRLVLQKVELHTVLFSNGNESASTMQSLMSGPHWLVSGRLFGYAQDYLELGFVALALAAIAFTDRERIARPLRACMPFAPVLLLIYARLAP